MNEDAYLSKIEHYIASATASGLQSTQINLLTPDASTRRYYRLRGSEEKSWVASVYPESFKKDGLPFLIMTNILRVAELPVPHVYDVHEELGVVLQEDLGDVSLSQWLAQPGRTEAEADARMKEAINLIVRIQALTQGVMASEFLPSTLAFDTEKLNWELNYFFEHFFSSLLRMQLSQAEANTIKSELLELAEWLSSRPRVLTHRDFHAMNLMVDSKGALRLIDYQDARMGPASYDLVPLLLERRMQSPSGEWVNNMQQYFLQARVDQGLPLLDKQDFQKEFMYMVVQRELKALGTFSYQTAVMGRGSVYSPYIKPTVQLVGEYVSRLSRLVP